MYNYDYKLPIITSTYKSNYGKGRTDIIAHDTPYIELSSFSLNKINKSIKVYGQVIKELHDISIHPCNPLKEKAIAYHEIIMRNLNLILGNIEPKELELITIEHYFIDRKEKLELVKSSKVFENSMKKLAKKAREKNQFRNKGEKK